MWKLMNMEMFMVLVLVLTYLCKLFKFFYDVLIFKKEDSRLNSSLLLTDLKEQFLWNILVWLFSTMICLLSNEYQCRLLCAYWINFKSLIMGTFSWWGLFCFLFYCSYLVHFALNWQWNSCFFIFYKQLNFCDKQLFITNYNFRNIFSFD